MLSVFPSSKFKKDVKRLEKRGKDMSKLKLVITCLMEEKSLSLEYKDHPLRGDWFGYRDLHIEPDWLLLYRIENTELQLARTGTHSDLFRD